MLLWGARMLHVPTCSHGAGTTREESNEVDIDLAEKELGEQQFAIQASSESQLYKVLICLKHKLPMDVFCSHKSAEHQILVNPPIFYARQTSNLRGIQRCKPPHGICAAAQVAGLSWPRELAPTLQLLTWLFSAKQSVIESDSSVPKSTTTYGTQRGTSPN